MANYLGKLELLEIKENDFTTEFTFLYEEMGEIREVTLFSGLYDSEKKKWMADEDQRAKYEANIESVFGVSTDNLDSLIANKYDVWEGDNGYSYLWEPVEIIKFDADMIGQIVNAEIVAIEEYEAKAVIKLSYEDKTYASNINWGKYIQALKKSLPDPQKKVKQLEKFEQKFHVPFSERESLVGKSVMIEVKKNPMDSTGKNPTYIDVKALPKPKK